MFGLTSSDIELITRVFRNYSEVEEVVIYGSRAMGNYKPGSDIDLALKGKKLSAETVTNIAVELNERLPLPYKFDVVDYSSITHKPYLEHIVQYGKPFYFRTWSGAK